MDGSRFYPEVQWSAASAVAKPSGAIDATLVKRAKAAYQVARAKFGGYGESWWIKFEPKKQDCHQALTAADDTPTSALLSNPCATDLYWGMDHCLCRSYGEKLRENRDFAASEVALLCDSILRLAEATGAVRLAYPEGEGDRKLPVDIEATLAAIENRINAPIDFPNPFAGEFGVETSRGIATFRAVQSIYQAWRLRTLAEVFGKKILEIGGGTGRTAYYAHRFGLTNYTIIDLPMTSVAQATFLGRTLGPNSIALAGERARRGQVRLETPSWFLKTHERFDIVVNIDSLTEMDQQHAAQYSRRIRGVARAFLSVNHEFNGFRVIDVAPLAKIPRVRSPYWMRTGYVEELFLIRKAAMLRPDKLRERAKELPRVVLKRARHLTNLLTAFASSSIRTFPRQGKA